ncbi:MAG: MFS transporter [Pseudomonadota bacterium]
MVGSALLFSWLLTDFHQLKLVRVIQGAALLSIVLNCIALWKQESRTPNEADASAEHLDFRRAWRRLVERSNMRRFLWVVGLGSLAFSMQDILLEPYGAQVLNLSVSATTLLTALLAGGALAAFAIAARRLGRGSDPCRLAAMGLMIGIVAFTAVLIAAPMHSTSLFRVGTVLIGFGGGLFAVSTLTAAVYFGGDNDNGLIMGAWSAVQATAIGGGIAIGGTLRDLVDRFASQGVFGPDLMGPAVGFSAVYQLEILFLFAALAIVGPLTKPWQRVSSKGNAKRFGLDQMPG